MCVIRNLTLEVSGGYEAQRNRRPVERLVPRFFRSFFGLSCRGQPFGAREKLQNIEPLTQHHIGDGRRGYNPSLPFSF